MKCKHYKVTCTHELRLLWALLIGLQVLQSTGKVSRFQQLASANMSARATGPLKVFLSPQMHSLLQIKHLFMYTTAFVINVYNGMHGKLDDAIKMPDVGLWAFGYLYIYCSYSS